ATGRYVTDLLLRAADAVAILGSDSELSPRPRAALLSEARAAVHRRAEEDPEAKSAVASAEDAVAAVRGLRRRELFRTGVADLLGRLDPDEVGEALTDITAITIEAALLAAVNKIEMERRGPIATRI